MLVEGYERKSSIWSLLLWNSVISFRVDGNNLIAMINLPCFEEVFGIWQNAKHLMVCDSKSSKYIAVSFLDDECLHILRRLGSFEFWNLFFFVCVDFMVWSYKGIFFFFHSFVALCILYQHPCPLSLDSWWIKLERISSGFYVL